MTSTEDVDPEKSRTILTLQQLVAISASGSDWKGLSREDILRRFARLLMSQLPVEFVCMRVAGTTDEQSIQVVETHCPDQRDAFFVCIQEAIELQADVRSQPAFMTIALPASTRNITIATQPFDVTLGRGQLIAGFSTRGPVPQETQLVLQFAANQTALFLQFSENQTARALQSHRAVADHRAQAQSPRTPAEIDVLHEMTIAADSSKRLSSEDALLESEQRFSRFMQNLPGLAWIKDINGRYVYVNDAAVNAFGVSRTQLYGKTDGEVFPSATAAQFRENDRRAIQSDVGLQVVEILEHPDGELRYSLVSKFPLFDAIGNVKLVGGMAIDITEQRRFEQALRQSEARFRSLMEQAPFSIQVFSPDGRTIRVNQAWETLWGVRFDEIAGYNILEDKQLEEKGIAAFIRKGFAGETCRIPAIEYNPNETIPEVARDPDPRRWLSAVIYPIKDADGRVQEVVLIHEDITLQHRAEEALLDAHRDLESKVALRTAELAHAESELRTAHEELERRVVQRTKELAHVNDALRDADRQKDELLTILTASEQFHRAIADLSTDYAFSGTIDADGSVHIYNVTEGFDKFYGMSLDEMNAQGGWASVIHPDDHPAVQQTIQRLMAGQTDRGELRAVCNGGTIKWQSYLTVPVRDEDSGRTIGLYGAATDVTAQRQLTEQLREQAGSLEAILSASVDNIYLFDRDGRYRYVSAGGAKILGFLPHEMTGKSWQELGLPAEIMETFDAQREQAIASGKSHRHDVSFTDKSGSVHHFEYSIAPVQDSNGNFSGAVVVSRNDTERKRAEEALQENDRRKDEFLATLAHELRNPLAPIRNGLEIMRLSKEDALAMEQARTMIERQIAHMVRLVDDLLDLSRISRGKIELRRERVDLGKVVQQAVETSRPLIEQAGHELTMMLPPAPIYVQADVTRLAQVFSNLLNNAAKYTEPGGRISLSVVNADREVAVIVQDNGIGIPPQMLPKVFDMFTQVDRNLDRSQGGLGIGLSIVKRLVEMHGGSVEARSEGDGRGSEFIVQLPLLPSLPPTAARNRESTKPTSGRKILVVDDNRDAAMSLAIMLKLMGNETMTAHDGLEALAIAETFRPDFIFLDIGMPRLNGYETAKRIRQHSWGTDIFLVALTGWGLEEDRRKSNEAGFDFHLVKPVEPAALDTLLANLQSQPSSRKI